MKISKVKITALRDYFLEGGSTDEEDVKAQLGTEDDEVMEAYIAALKERYPDEFGGGEEAETEEAPQGNVFVRTEPVAEWVTPTYFLKDANNILRELEVVSERKGRLIFQISEPKDLVDLLLRGEKVTVDLIQLRKFPDGQTFGLPNSRLIELAELAKL